MLYKIKYKPYGEPIHHFEKYFEKYIQSKIRNEKDFLEDFLNMLELYQIDSIVSKAYRNELQKTEKIIKKIDNLPNLVSKKLIPIINDYKKVCRKLPKGERILYFIQMKREVEKVVNNQFVLNQTRVFYNSLLTKIDYEISRNTRVLREELKGKKNPDPVDVLSAFLVLKKNEAKIIFENAQIADDSRLQFRLEAQIDDWLIEEENEYFFPNVNVDDGAVKITRLNINDIKKNLTSFDFPITPFIQNNLLNIRHVKTEGLLINCLKDLFQSIDKSFHRKDAEIFYCSITQVFSPKYANREMKITQTRINKLFIENEKSTKQFLALINSLYLANVITGLSNLYKVLEEYLISKVIFSEGTFNDLAYDTPDAYKNYEAYKAIIDKILPESIKNKAILNRKNKNY